MTQAIKLLRNSGPLVGEANIDLEEDPPADYGEKKNLRLIFSSRKAFYAKCFNVDLKTAQDWRWQLANRVTDLNKLREILCLSKAELNAFVYSDYRLPFSVTPYYLSLIHPTDLSQPLRKSVIPSIYEFHEDERGMNDPLGEDSHSPVPGLVHRYPDRVLFLVTQNCSVYCRYCTRSRMVGDKHCDAINQNNWDAAIQYIESHKEIRDILISGGDPLLLEDEALESILKRLRKIKHVEMIRIGSKVPAVLPQRVTHSLCKMLKKYHPLFLSLHFTHPDELTSETRRACERLADAGIPLGSQTVLLKDINNDVSVMKKLMQGLLKVRVRPYYIYQCDPIVGSKHFRTTIKDGLDIIKGLRGHTSGYAVPHYVIDAPGGGGKIPLLPDYYQGETDDSVVLRNYEDQLYYYPKD